MLVQRKKPWTKSPRSRDNHQKPAPVHGSKSSGNPETHPSRAPRPDSRSDLAGASGSTNGKGRKGRKDLSVGTADKTEGKYSGKGVLVPFSFQFGSPARNQASPISYPGGSAMVFASLNQCSGQLDLGSNTLTKSGQKSRKGSAKAKGSVSLHGSRSQVSVGHPETRKNPATLNRNASSDQSKPYHDLGMVRPRGDEGLEPHLSFNAFEQKDRVSSTNRSGLDGVAQPLVDIPVGQANKSGSKSIRLESTVAAFAGAKLERRRPRRASCGKENVDVQNSKCEVLGKRGIKNSDSDVPNNQAFQLTDQLQGDAAEVPTAFDNNGRRGQLVLEDVERDEMETSECVRYADCS